MFEHFSAPTKAASRRGDQLVQRRYIKSSP